MYGITAIENPPRELAYRENDGIEVALFWSPEDDELTVVVVDTKLGDAFDVPVGDAPPLDVFYHPYAYATQRQIDYALA
jgi:hypothetical protein